MADKSDRDNDGVSDVMESIEQILSRINEKIPERSSRPFFEDQSDQLKSVSTKLSSRDRVDLKPGKSTTPQAHGSLPGQSSATPEFILRQILQTLQLLQKTMATGKPSSSPSMPRASPPPLPQALAPQGTTQSPAPTSQPTSQGNWWTRLIDKLGGRDEHIRRLEKQEKEAREKLDNAKKNVAEAPIEFRDAQRGLAKAQFDLFNAKRYGRGQDTKDQQEEVKKARQRLDQAQDRLNTAPRQVQEAEKEHIEASRELGPARAGGKRRAAARIAHGLGFESLGKELADSAETAELGARASAGDPAAKAQLAQKAVDKALEGVRNTVQGASKALVSERAGDALSGAGQATQGLGKLTGNPALQGLGMFAKTVGESVERLRRWNDQILDSNLRFAEFSGAMARVQAEHESRQIRLSQERGDRRAPTAQRQAEARDRLERNLAPVEDWWSNVRGEISTMFSNWFSNVIEAIQGEQTQAGGPPISFTDWVGGAQETTWAEQFGRPERFPRNTNFDWVRMNGRRP